jgi:hypothetical protein
MLDFEAFYLGVSLRFFILFKLGWRLFFLFCFAYKFQRPIWGQLVYFSHYIIGDSCWLIEEERVRSFNTDDLDDFLFIEVISEFVELLKVFNFHIFWQSAFILFLFVYDRGKVLLDSGNKFLNRFGGSFILLFDSFFGEGHCQLGHIWLQFRLELVVEGF